MKNNKKLKVGDKIIRCNKVYRIFKIENIKTASKEETIILYKPYFKTGYNRRLTLSIPFKNFDRANIRLPMIKKELNKFFKELSRKSRTEVSINILDAKEILNLNDPYKNIEVLKRLMAEKNDKTANFTKSKQDIFNQAITQLVEEIAFVGGFSLAQAERKIQKSLG